MRDVGDFISEESCLDENGREQDFDTKEMEHRLGLLGPHEFWGEDAMLIHRVQLLVTARAVSFTEMRLLAREKFIEVAQNSPKVRAKVARMSKHQKSDDEQNTNSPRGPLPKPAAKETFAATAKRRNPTLPLLDSMFASVIRSPGGSSRPAWKDALQADVSLGEASLSHHDRAPRRFGNAPGSRITVQQRPSNSHNGDESTSGDTANINRFDHGNLQLQLASQQALLEVRLATADRCSAQSPVGLLLTTTAWLFFRTENDGED